MCEGGRERERERGKERTHTPTDTPNTHTHTHTLSLSLSPSPCLSGQLTGIWGQMKQAVRKAKQSRKESKEKKGVACLLVWALWLLRHALCFRPTKLYSICAVFFFGKITELVPRFFFLLSRLFHQPRMLVVGGWLGALDYSMHTDLWPFWPHILKSPDPPENAFRQSRLRTFLTNTAQNRKSTRKEESKKREFYVCVCVCDNNYARAS